MNPELALDIKIKISDCDAFGRWRPSNILGYTQEMAEVHAASFGLDRNTMLESGVCWIIYRQVVRMHAYPTYHDPIRITTWPGMVEGPIFPRYFVMERPDGSRVGEIVSSWLLMSVETRRPQRPSMLPRAIPRNDREPPLPLPPMLRVEGAKLVGARGVCYSDLDVNGHMNNTRYIDWICDALGMEVMREKGLSRFQVNYIAEAQSGEMLELSEKRNGEDIYLLGQRASDRKTVFEACVSFA